MPDQPPLDSGAARIFAYLEDVVKRYSPIAHFQIGYPDEQAGAGNTPYPQVFLEAEMQIGEERPGLDTYQVALHVLSLPAEHGTNEGTRLQAGILATTGGYVEELVEILRLEEELTDVKKVSAVSLTDVSTDQASGWRVEISFTYPSAVNREALWSRYTPA
ncbi:hypothetical protein [Hymenobacter metallilatus]|uniref:Uncharacterized protein n=1 Tax=Hymenobacter metallilatus TaxID=2493666 RepID=A0A3R9MKG7_9BACT|nr:hypothetical protein [Hymenobacter metallilatus]RSK33949.1 hypothetical protein EI290_09595 [Hymenobacter metallilatus]